MDKGLTILCFDGLDPDEANRLNMNMPYQTSLTIQEELYHEGSPHTLNIWPSMFTGQITLYPDFDLEKPINPLRLRIRNELTKRGIKWRRRGLKVETHKDLKVHELEDKLSRPRKLETSTVFEMTSSLILHIPRIDPLYIWGANLDYAESEYQRVLALSLMLGHNKMLKAYFSRILDLLGHYSQDSSRLYKEVFEHANYLAKMNDVILISDHGCINGLHTLNAYMGASFPFKAETVLDVRQVIEERLEAY